MNINGNVSRAHFEKNFAEYAFASKKLNTLFKEAEIKKQLSLK